MKYIFLSIIVCILIASFVIAEDELLYIGIKCTFSEAEGEQECVFSGNNLQHSCKGVDSCSKNYEMTYEDSEEIKDASKWSSSCPEPTANLEDGTLTVWPFDAHGGRQFNVFVNCAQAIEHECVKHNDCDDNDDSTTDRCDYVGEIKKCSNKKVSSCKSGDDYCPDDCSYEDDTDCEKPEIQKDECLSDSDCDDGLVSTEDICSGSPKKCTNPTITKCISNDDYCPSNCNYDLDTDCPEPDQCSTSTDCDDSNACTEDICDGSPKKCENRKLSNGCNVDGQCLPISTRTETEFCDTDSSMKTQKESGNSCNNYYECSSNVCVSGECVSPSIIKKILSWFTKWFN